MTIRARRSPLARLRLGLASTAVLALAACGSPTSSASDPDEPDEPAASSGDATSEAPMADGDRPQPADPEGLVGGLALVLENDGPAVACFGSVADSAPPQCGGPEIDDWDWAAVPADTVESAGSGRWGDYYLEGHLEDGRLRLTQEPVHEAVFEPDLSRYEERSWPDEDAVGTLRGRDAVRAQRELLDAFADADTSEFGNGTVEVGVLWDDGTLQAWADERYGAGNVVVWSHILAIKE